MRLLDTIEQESIGKLCPYAQRLLEELRPLIKNLDPLKIGDGKDRHLPIKERLVSAHIDRTKRQEYDSAICAKYAIISLVRLVKVGAVIESTKPHGKAILE